MNSFKLLLAAGAAALIAGSAQAVTVDALLGAEDLGNSGDATELAALCDWIDDNANNGTSNCGDLEIQVKYDDDQFVNLLIQDTEPDGDDSQTTYYVDLPDGQEPGYFILKFGGGGFDGPDTFFFENLADLNTLAWIVPDQVDPRAWGDCLAGDTVGENSTCRLSHITTVIPLPAAGWLLLAGVGGLAAVSRRKKA